MCKPGGCLLVQMGYSTSSEKSTSAHHTYPPLSIGALLRECAFPSASFAKHEFYNRHIIQAISTNFSYLFPRPALQETGAFQPFAQL